jgi:hypothetical protein
MFTVLIIFLTQKIPARINVLHQNLRYRKSGGQSRIPIIEDIDHFSTSTTKVKHALITLDPAAWLTALQQYPDIRLFNYFGLTFEIVKALNEAGYKVDIVDMNREHIPTKQYDLLIGHGGKCRTIIEHLAPNSVIFQYVSGAYWRVFNEESKQRYERFAKSRGIDTQIKYVRDLSELLDGEEYLLQKADCLFFFNCPRTIESFGIHRKKFFFTGFGAYTDPALMISCDERNHNAGRRNFIYVGGTGGNVQKGMDILIEAFAKKPSLHLYIYCKVEKEIIDNYKKELSLPNIHYVYFLRYPIFSSIRKRLLQKISFSVHAPINTGLGTAFMGTMGLGLIPVGYVDLAENAECTVLTDHWDVDSIANCISQASEKSIEWCVNASTQITKEYECLCGTESLRSKFKELFSDENVHALRQRRNVHPQV